MLRIVKKKNFCIVSVFILITFLIIYRGPCFLTEGTLDGVEFEFYNYAKDNGLIKGLFYVYETASYFKLWTNIANTFASLFSFESAKIITKFFSVIIYYTIFTYIIFFGSKLFYTFKQKIFAICVILFSPGMTPEIWMGSAHIREYFGIFAFILLFYDPTNDTNLKKTFSHILVVFTFLSSIWAAALSPVYFIKYLFNKNKNNLIFFLSSFICSLIQFTIVLQYHFLKSVGTASRFQVGTDKIFSFIYNVPVRSFFGSTIPKYFFAKTDIYLFYYFNFVLFFTFLILIIFLLIYIFRKKDFLLNLILLSFILVSIFAIAGSFPAGFVGGRYAVLSCVILTFLVFRIFTLESNLIIKKSLGALLLLSLIIGLVEFKYKSPLPNVLSCKTSVIYSKN
jgi:hypothetical protein